MKHFYNILFFLLIFQLLNAQSDTTFQKITTEEGVFEKQQFVDAKKQLLNLLLDEPSLFKVGFEGITFPLENKEYGDRYLAKGIFISYEHRLKTGFSISARLNYHRTDHTVLLQKRLSWLGIHDYVIHRFSAEIEPRWYFLKKKDIQSGKSGNNLNGLYVGNTIGLQHWQRPGSFHVMTTDGRNYYPYLKGNYQYSTLNLGWQRRFGKHGFLHFQLGAGIRHNDKFDFPEELLSPESNFEQLPKWQSLMTYKAGIGIAVGKAENTQVDKPILAFHKEDLTMWKLDLFPILLGFGKNKLLSKISVAYEQGIKHTPFSFNTNLIYIHPNKLEYGSSAPYFSTQFAFRFYYNLKKRMAKGKTANNLSAEYFAIRPQWELNDYSYFGHRDQKHSLAFLWGIQRRIFERMFVNYEFGYETNYKWYLNNFIVSELKIGLAF